jgi:RNA polymerase sigma-70 factor (ECF subfamily)
MSKGKSELENVLADYRPKIQRYLARLVGTQEAEDLAQEVGLKIARAFEDFDGRSKLSTWIYRIATNTAIDRLRSSSYRTSTDMIPEEELVAEDQAVFGTTRILSMDQRVIEQEMNACIRNFVDHLQAPYRTVLVLSEFERLKNQEIASILGISLDLTKIRLHRARALLKKELERGCDFYHMAESQLACEPAERSSTPEPTSRQDSNS